jgi:cytochrome c553
MQADTRHQPEDAAQLTARRVAILLLSLSFGGLGHGQTSAPPPQHLPACMSCHGEQGVSATPEVPNLAGQKELYLRAQLRAFREGRRSSDLMAPVARQLDDAAIGSLAAYWSAVVPSSPTPSAAQADRAATDAAARAPSHMVFPAGFPQGFVAYSSEVVAGGRVVQIRYANAAAWAAMRAGRSLPEGSVVIAANHTAVPDANGQPSAGELRTYVGMESRAGWGEALPALLRNGNWHYGQWTPKLTSRLGGQHAQCLACHKPLEAASFLFSAAQFRRAAAAR